MKPALKLLGLGAACIACCSIPAMGSLLVGLGLGGLGAASLGWGAGLALLASAGAALLVVARKRQPVACDTSSRGCGCAGPKMIAPTASAE